MRYGLASLQIRRDYQCAKLFDTIFKPSHSLYHLLPPRHVARHNLRGENIYIYLSLAGFSKRCSLKLCKKTSFCHKKP